MIWGPSLSYQKENTDKLTLLTYPIDASKSTIIFPNEKQKNRYTTSYSNPILKFICIYKYG